MISLLALHRIAAQRGDGLHPALVTLLERSDCTENHGTSPALVESSDSSAALSLIPKEAACSNQKQEAERAT
jgi:hypothetical protein